jgi:hypothetical protein
MGGIKEIIAKCIHFSAKKMKWLIWMMALRVAYYGVTPQNVCGVRSFSEKAVNP